MPNFKPKASKKIKVNNKSIVTLDSKHNEKMKEFYDISNNQIPKLQKRKQEIKTKLKQSNITLSLELDLKDELKEIRSKIKKLKNEKKYLLENSEYIFEYFEKRIFLKMAKKKKVMHSFSIKKENTIMKNDNETSSTSNINKYLVNLDDSFLNINNYIYNYEYCKNCGGEYIPVDYEGLIICNKCGLQKQYLIERKTKL